MFSRFRLLAFLLLFALPASASISLTQSNHGTSSGTNTATCALSSTLASGDLVIVDVNWGETAAVNSDYGVTDGASTTYSSVLGSPLSQTNQLSIWYGKLSSGQSSLTITVTISNHGNHTIRIGCFDYHSPTGWASTPLDHSSSNSSSTAVTSGNPGNVTPSASGYLVHSAIEFSVATNTNSVASPCTMQPAGGTNSTGWISDGRANSADDQNSGSSAETCSYTWANASAYGSIIATFAPATAAPTIPRHIIIDD